MSHNKHTLQKKAAPIGSPISAFSASEEILKSLGAKEILDCPAGQGAFAEMLMEHEMNIACCDIRPEEFLVDEIECQLCDMNDSLPYEDESFDAVTCLNGIHRIWARGRAVGEMARVLKPGGHLIITIPNPTNIMRRLSYFATGVSIPNTVGPPDTFLPEASIPSAYVRLPITIPEIDAVCKASSFEIKQVSSIKTCKASVLLSPLIVPIWILSPLARAKGRLRPCASVNTMTSLLSERILILLQKE